MVDDHITSLGDYSGVEAPVDQSESHWTLVTYLRPHLADIQFAHTFPNNCFHSSSYLGHISEGI